MNKNIKNMCKELKREFRSEYGMGNNLFIDAVDLTDCYNTSERGALALEINYLADNETKALSKTIFVLTNNNVVHYTIIYKKNV